MRQYLIDTRQLPARKGIAKQKPASEKTSMRRGWIFKTFFGASHSRLDCAYLGDTSANSEIQNTLSGNRNQCNHFTKTLGTVQQGWASALCILQYSTQFYLRTLFVNFRRRKDFRASRSHSTHLRYIVQTPSTKVNVVRFNHALAWIHRWCVINITLFEMCYTPCTFLFMANKKIKFGLRYSSTTKVLIKLTLHSRAIVSFFRHCRVWAPHRLPTPPWVLRIHNVDNKATSRRHANLHRRS